MEKTDSSGKDKSILLDIPTIKDVSYVHWNKHARIKWSLTFFVGIVLVYSVRVSMSVCAPAMGKEFDWSKQVSGMMLSAFFCGYVTTNVIGGYLADRHGGDVVMFHTSIVWSTLTLLLPFSTTYLISDPTTSVLFIRFLTGVTQGVFFPSFTAILTKHVAVAERGFVYNFAFSGASAGTILTGFAGSIMIEQLGWGSVFTVVGVLALLWCTWLRWLMGSPQQSGRNVAANWKEKKPVEPIPWSRFASQWSFWALFVSYFCSNYCFYNLLSWIPVYFHDVFPQSKGWVFNVVPWLANFIMTNTCGVLLNVLISFEWSITRIRKVFASTMFLGILISSLLLNTVSTFRQALIVMTINVSVHAFGTGSLMMNASDLAPQHSGALFGFMNSCGAFAGFVGVYMTGYILEVTGDWSSVNHVSALFSAIGFCVFSTCGSAQRLV